MARKDRAGGQAPKAGADSYVELTCSGANASELTAGTTLGAKTVADAATYASLYSQIKNAFDAFAVRDLTDREVLMEARTGAAQRAEHLARERVIAIPRRGVRSAAGSR